MYKRVLVPLDGSRLAEGILPFIVEIARPLDLEVVLVRVEHPSDRRPSTGPLSSPSTTSQHGSARPGSIWRQSPPICDDRACGSRPTRGMAIPWPRSWRPPARAGRTSSP